ncbi:hypothetical protein D9M68_234930 [compost metagenome]
MCCDLPPTPAATRWCPPLGRWYAVSHAAEATLRQGQRLQPIRRLQASGCRLVPNTRNSYSCEAEGRLLRSTERTKELEAMEAMEANDLSVLSRRRSGAAKRRATKCAGGHSRAPWGPVLPSDRLAHPRAKPPPLRAPRSASLQSCGDAPILQRRGSRQRWWPVGPLGAPAGQSLQAHWADRGWPRCPLRRRRSSTTFERVECYANQEQGLGDGAVVTPRDSTSRQSH